jgi:Ca2+-binding EF-hand superfamily protein
MRKSLLVLAWLAATPALAQNVSLDVFDTADTNHDGRITRAEFAAAREKQFDRMDRNHDGAVSKEDFGFLLALAPSREQRLDRFIAGADANNDKRVTREEFRASPMRLFDRADTNTDGVVDAAELAALRKTGAE